MILIDENGSFINRIVLKGIKQHPVAYQKIVLLCIGAANSECQYNSQEKRNHFAHILHSFLFSPFSVILPRQSDNGCCDPSSLPVHGHLYKIPSGCRIIDDLICQCIH